MKNHSLIALALITQALIALALSGCQPSGNDGVLTMTVSRGEFQVNIPASGELEAAQSTPVVVPTGLRGPQSLAWIQNNFTQVKAGDVVARLDDTRESFRLQMEAFDFERLAQDAQIQTEKDLTLSQSLTLGSKVTGNERQLAERFFSEDERVYTKIDIIDQMRNKEYLDAKLDYFQWGGTQHQAQADAEQALIKLKQKGHQAKMDRYQGNLSQMEIIAPHDGLFVYQAGWDGAFPVVGDMIWSGFPIGILPDTSVMQARVYVLESEAVGLAIGKQATVTLDAYPERPFSGTVTQVDALAKPKDRDSPVNYFQFTISLDQTLPAIMQPGRQVNAKVQVLDLNDVLTVPNQALFQKDGRYWVFLKQGGGFVRRDVTPGHRSLNRTEITAGLNPGDVIALTTPPKRSQL
ncbi:MULTISPECIES: efflux RND transporter periplasmic adaptor subunit [Shewanella]|uniref:HlyD family efflux transporter periplasmic adaptor subunit n=1 Tax=Shewanella chilikensis TaxID=558541 RepID=A0A6G7LRC2_9GAMM|nr:MULTISPECIES: HlyD family efflux transporter periplasmic adaptor subunit [Shewanella]MCL1153910.1 HlyD family efflux transporter periplasmic adaptor subunit [Shewanella chilikensis]NJI84031.1 HlyD family efflux transporter periplasmic adaptor subunit [Shewanella sp. Iso12]PYE59987.1 multidrug efflux pump subunit AcrA (membrane-fusion protein) [Shewanella chilikensis]QIJ04264.1 HlyD family efflux transporter periplasmic adaptor subunit [Shewanella chilikensis]GGZ20282.1 secretion protein Hly